jgi:predicted metal-dependent hydrolase
MDYSVIRSRRRTVSLEVTPDAQILVRAPFEMTDADLARIVDGRKAWLKDHVRRQEARKKSLAQVQPLTVREADSLKVRARADLTLRTARQARLMGLCYGRVTIRLQKTRWGSCSSKGNLNYNALLMLAPEAVRDYVVIHELCHLVEMNHSPRFWAQVERYCPDYDSRRSWLKVHGDQLMARAFPV